MTGLTPNERFGTAPSQLDTQVLADLVFAGLDHGIDSAREGGGPLTPYTSRQRDVNQGPVYCGTFAQGMEP